MTPNRYMSIREAATDPRCPIREGTLRAMVKRKEIPGFFAGRRFWVDFDGMIEMLAERSRSFVQTGKQA